MGITFRDVLRGLGGAASYVAEDLREQRIDEREEQQAIDRARLQREWQKESEKADRAFKREQLQQEYQLRTALDMKKIEFTHTIDQIGIADTRESMRLLSMPQDNQERIAGLDAIQQRTMLLNQARTGEFNEREFSDEEKQIISTMSPELSRMFSMAVLEQRRYNQEFEQKKAVQEAQINMYNANAERDKALAEKYGENWMQSINPLEANEEYLTTLKQMTSAMQDRDFKQALYLIEQGDTPDQLPTHLRNVFKLNTILLQTLNRRAKVFGALAGINTMTPEPEPPPPEEEYEAPAKQKLTADDIADALSIKPVANVFSEVIKGGKSTFKRFKESFESQRRNIKRLKEKHGIKRKVYSYDQFQRLRESGELIPGMVMYVNGNLWVVNKNADGVNKVT